MRNPNAAIRIKGHNFDFTCPLGFGRPTVTGGGAVYEEETRPQTTAVTVYSGNTLMKMSVPVLFNGFLGPGKNVDISSHVDQVVGLAFGRDGHPPPDFAVSGPFEFSGMRCQMELPEWSETPPPIVGPGGNVFRQALILKLVQFEDPDSLRIRRTGGPFRRNDTLGSGQPGLTASTVVKPGENLLKVSIRIYGKADEAKKIGNLNGIRDTRQQLKAGRTLRLPR